MTNLPLYEIELEALQAAIIGYSLELKRVFPNNSAAESCIRTLDGVLDKIDEKIQEIKNENTYDL